MKARPFATLLISSTCVAVCAAHAQGVGDDMVPDPSIKARVIAVNGRASAEKLKGTCNVIRDAQPGVRLKAGTWLLETDVIDLGTSCVMTLSVQGHKDVKISWRDGRFARIATR